MTAHLVHRGLGALILAAAVLFLIPSPASAQFGIGPRLSFVRGDVPSSTPSTSFIGGTVRMSTTKHLSFEVALDYRSQTNADNSARLRSTPFQMSVLIYPTPKRALAPYLVGGYGIYTDTTQTLGIAGNVTATSTARHQGFHMGFGGEFFVNKHTSLYMDYRFRFVHIGGPDATSQAVPLPVVHLAHTGSMFTSGMAFYF
jgi:hypothetical protein